MDEPHTGGHRLRRWASRHRQAWRVRRAGRTHRLPRYLRHWYSRPSILGLEAAALALGLVSLYWWLRAVLVLTVGWDWWPHTSSWCDRDENTAECAVIAGVLNALLALGLSTSIFILWRLRSAKGPVRRKLGSDRDARDYLPTARNSIMDTVVGRDELCEVIADQLRSRQGRRPHLLVGGVGAGKTAVMVHLTRVLWQRGVIPVPVRLRGLDGSDDLDFEALAKERFCKVVDAGTLLKGVGVKAVGEPAWRWLRKQDRVVVLADGLEEVFAEGPKQNERDNQIRNAIQRADKDNLPLVMASRPHGPLTDVEAAVTELEPLSEEAAVGYVEEVVGADDAHRLDWVVEGGGVSDEPLYLQVARQLNTSRRLEHPLGRDEHDVLDTRDLDRAGLRHHLLHTWVEAVIHGHLMTNLALTKDERQEAIEQISALACVGLQRDSIEVRFDELVPPAGGAGGDGAGPAPGRHTPGGFPAVKQMLEERLRAAPPANPATNPGSPTASAPLAPSLSYVSGVGVTVPGRVTSAAKPLSTCRWPPCGASRCTWWRRSATGCASSTASCRPIWPRGS